MDGPLPENGFGRGRETAAELSVIARPIAGADPKGTMAFNTQGDPQRTGSLL
jgi:hypothetical protein